MDDHTKSHLHESPKTMTVPLIILAVLSAIGGLIGIPHILGAAVSIPNAFEHWLDPVFAQTNAVMATAGAHHAPSLEIGLMVGSVVLALVSIFAARYLYLKNPEAATKLKASFAGLHRLLEGKYFIDEIYEKIIIRPIHGISVVFWKLVDVLMIDGLINGGAFFVGAISRLLKPVQSGRLTAYLTVFTIGVLILAGVAVLIFLNNTAEAISFR